MFNVFSSKIKNILKENYKDIIILTSFSLGVMTLTSDKFFNFAVKKFLKSKFFEKRSDGVEIEFENLSGCLFCGKYLFTNLKISKESELQLKIEKLATVLTLESIFKFLRKKKDLSFDALSVIGMQGKINQNASEKKRKNIQLNNIQLSNVNLDLMKENEIYKLNCEYYICNSFPFEEGCDILFRQSFKGSLDGNEIELNSSVPGVSSFTVRNFSMETLNKINPNFPLFSGGNVNLDLDSVLLKDDELELSVSLNLSNLKLKKMKRIQKLVEHQSERINKTDFKFKIKMKKEDFSVRLLKNQIFDELIKNS
jgi:hypothetical protein